ncbi:MAG TPA: hypothetical protein VIM70_07715 [Clostridium sp.]|uniref:hypothetical protein n=1 Tax=Clostridium sp. TaxID=1506 RepID=UPI002F936173
MKEKVIDWVDSCNKKEIFYWVHFVFYFLSNLNVYFVSYVRASILVMYLLAFLYLFIKNHKFKLPPRYFLIAFGLYVVFNTLIIRNFSVHIVYCIISFIIIKELKFTKSQVLSLINKTAIVYLLVSLVLNYTPLSFLSLYNDRLITNKFFPHLLYRFLGIEGTPAGADIFYSLVLISNIVLNKTKNRRFFITLSVIILVWTSSFAPILSIVGALLILPFSNNKVAKATYGSMIWLYQFIIIFIYSFGFVHLNEILNVSSTWRARIWFKMYWSLVSNSTLSTWNLGRKALVNFVHQTTTNNPHNYSLFLLEFAGIPMFIIIIGVTTMYFANMKDKYMIFVVATLFIYASTNTFIFSIRGNPIFLYILVTYLSFENEPKIE